MAEQKVEVVPKVSLAKKDYFLAIELAWECGKAGKRLSEAQSEIENEVKVRNSRARKVYDAENAKPTLSQLDFDEDVEVSIEGNVITLNYDSKKLTGAGTASFTKDVAYTAIARMKASDFGENNSKGYSERYDKATGRPYFYQRGVGFVSLAFVVFAQKELGLSNEEISELKGLIKTPASE